MTAREYFGDWWNIIPSGELKLCTDVIGQCNERVTPNKSLVFKAFKECPYNDLRVIFLAQDPYPQKDIATGLAFGNNNDFLSPSLEIIKEACINYTIPHSTIIFDNTLESWARQGVLLLNSALTCEINRPGSHSMIWRPFISKLLRNLSINNPGLVYILFGEQAQTFEPYISKYNDIIKVKHPAYYARTNTKMPNIFTNIDKLLINKNGKSINWFIENN